MRFLWAPISALLGGAGTFFYLEEKPGPYLKKVEPAHELEEPTASADVAKAADCPACPACRACPACPVCSDGSTPVAAVEEADAVSQAASAFEGVVGLASDLVTYGLGLKPQKPADLFQKASEKTPPEAKKALATGIAKVSELLQPVREKVAVGLTGFLEKYPAHNKLAEWDPLLLATTLTVLFMLIVREFLGLLSCCCRRKRKPAVAASAGGAAAPASEEAASPEASPDSSPKPSSSGRKSVGGKKNAKK